MRTWQLCYARIELRNTTVRFVDGYSNTALVNEPSTAPAIGDTEFDIDGLGTSEAIPNTTRFTVPGSSKRYKITEADANAEFSVDVGAASGGTFTLTFEGEVTAAINYNETAANVLAALEALSNVASGDLSVTGSGTTGDPWIIKTLKDGAHADTAVTLTGDGSSLSPSDTLTVTTTHAGGVTHNITFTPSLDVALSDNDAVTITGRTLDIKVGDGNITYTENKDYSYDLDRGNLDTVRELDQIPLDFTLDMTWEFLSAVSGAETPTPEDALKKSGPASSWVSSSSDACEPYAIDIEIDNVPPCGSDPSEVITLPDARYESLEHDADAAQLSMSGRCNAVQATLQRI